MTPDDGPEPIRLTVDQTRWDEVATGTLTLALPDGDVALELSVPAGVCRSEDVLPVAHGLADLFAARGTARVAAVGRTVSCRAGCGACCRQLVPIATSEAVALAALVAAMPEPRQARVRARFAAALAELDRHGMLARIADPVTMAAPDLATDYFRIGLACPFLEDESCSIHADRPLVCREYLVTSDPRHCRDWLPAIEPVPLDRRPSYAVLRAEPERGWTALVLALRLAETAPSPAARPGPAILRAWIAAMREQSGAGPSSPPDALAAQSPV